MTSISITDIAPYELIKSKLGAKEAEAVVEFVKAEVSKELDAQKNILATKTDVKELEVKIAQVQANLIKWMFVFWIGSVATLSGVMIALLTAYLK